MGRDFKFRAWDKVNKRFGYLDHSFDNNWYGSPSPFGAAPAVFTNNWRDKRAEDFEIMQFTGLHDKNGKEIYGDDVVRVKKPRGITVDYGYFEITGQVFYHNGSYYIGGQDVLLSSMRYGDIEVIGNIHENPSLLEAKS